MSYFGFHADEKSSDYEGAVLSTPEQNTERLTSGQRWNNFFTDLTPTKMLENTTIGVGKAAATSGLLAYDGWAALDHAMLGPDVDKQDEAVHASILALTNSLKPDPKTTSFIGDTIYGVSSVLPQFILGEAAGGPLGGPALAGASQANLQTQNLVAQGVDPATAIESGAMTGVTTAAIGLIAPSYGSAITTKLLTGAGVNVGLGGVQRGGNAAILRANGYDDMADQYKIFDANAMVTDAVLGAAFGVLHTPEIKEEPPTRPAAPDAPDVMKSEGPVPISPEPAAGMSKQQENIGAVIRQKARELSPMRMGEYESLVADRERLGTEVRTAIASRQDYIDNNRPFDADIADIQSKIPDATARMVKKYEERIVELQTKNKEWVDGELRKETPEMQTVREQLQAVDYKLRDMAEKISAIHREAEKQFYAGIKPSHVDAAFSMNAALQNEDMAPGIPADPIAREAHTQAMARATEQLLNDQPVNVDGAISNGNFVPHPVDPAKAAVAKRVMEETGTEKAISDARAAVKEEARSPEPLPPEGEPVAAPGTEQAPLKPSAPAQPGKTEDLGAEDISRAQNIIAEKPELKIVDDNGNETTAAEAFAKADEEIAKANEEAKLYNIAIDCFLRG